MKVTTNKSSPSYSDGNMVLMAARVIASAMLTMLVVPTSSTFFNSTALTAKVQPHFTESSSRSLSPSSNRSFSGFNKIFESASILIPNEFKVSEEVASIDLDLKIWNINCYDISVGDISVGHEQISATTIFVSVDVTDITITCEMDYNYGYGILSGDGWVQIQTQDSDVSSTISFTSLDFDRNYPPTDSAINGCFSAVGIKQMDFEEDFVSEVLEVFQGLLRSTVEMAIGDVACEELSVIGTDIVGNMIDMAADQLEPYLGSLEQDIVDPLYFEKNLILPDTLQALNLQDTEGHVGKTFNEILQFFDTYIGTSISNPSGSDADSLSKSNKSVINTVLRSFFLNDDGSLTLDQTFISKHINPILLEGHDRLTEFTVTLNEIRLYGLDSITRLNSFRTIGKHTLQNELTWDLLKFEFDMIVDIKPSRLDDAILINPTSEGISEHFIIDFTVNNVEVEASLLLVLDEMALGSMKLGPLFFTENLLPCLLSAAHQVKVSGLDVNPSFIYKELAVNSLLSSGLDRAISDSVEAAFAMYEGSLRVAIPIIFQTRIRDLINSFLVDDGTNSTCPKTQSFEEAFIDFRKFFSTEDNTYGDLSAMLKSLLDDELLSINPETGTPRINEAVLAPFTEAQSGITGTVIFPTDLFSFLIPKTESKKFGLETVELRLFNPTIVNLDTLGAPLQLLEPNATRAQVLDNYATLGSADRKFTIGLKGLFAVEGDPALAMSDQIDLSMELAGSDALLSFMAKVDPKILFNFPLHDITNIQCWLHTLVTPEDPNDNENVGFSILNALLMTSSISFNLACDTCTSSSLDILPEILDWLETFGVSDVIERRFVTLIMDLLSSDFSQHYINEVLLEAALRCPHSPHFVGFGASISEDISAKFPSLDHHSLETITFMSIVMAEIVTVLMAQELGPYDLEKTFPLSGQNDLSIANDIRLVDFTSIDTYLGEWASSFIELVGNSNGANDMSDLRINRIIRSFLLDENGRCAIKFDGLDLEVGLGISVKEVSIAGVDTISELVIFDAIGPQTIQNGILWKDVRIQFVLSLERAENLKEQDIVISIELSNVNFSVALLMAIDLDLLNSLQMRSIMELKKLLPCLISTTTAANFTELELSIGSISNISITGFESNEIGFSANESTKLILVKYSETILSSIPKFFDSTVRTLLNNWLKHQIDEFSSDLCKNWPSDEINDSRFVDLRDLLLPIDVASRLGGTGLSPYGDMFRIGMELVQDIFKTDDKTGLSGFNEAVVVPLTQSKDSVVGTLSHNGDFYNGINRIKIGALDTNIQFRAYDAKIENLNTVGEPLDLFGGMVGEAYMMNNTVAAGIGETPLHLSSKFQLSLEGDDNMNIHNEVDLSLDLTNVTMIFSTLTKLVKSRLYAFPLRDVFDLNCWLALIPAPPLESQGVRNSDSPLNAAILQLEAYVREVKVTANCTNCSSPRMTEFTDLISSPDAQNQTTDVANALLDYVTKLMGGNYLQVQIDRMINDASRMCPHSPSYDPKARPFAYEDFQAPNTTFSMSYLIVLTTVVLTMMLIMATTMLTVKWIVRRRHMKWLIKLPAHQFKNLSSEQKSEQFFEDTLNSTTISMSRSQDIPCIVRLMIPIVIACNILFFLSGHLSLGATVNLEAEIAGEKFVIEKFFEFSMARSTVDIWKAGGRELAILILIFSGVWPYTKLLTTLWLWFSSPSNISVSRRGSILLWLDCLAKWSMVDIFVLVISIAAFRISIESPDALYLPNNFYAIEMMVIPLWGLYANMIAQLISQITSHIIIYYHRRIVTKATDRLNQGSLREGIFLAGTEARDQNPEGHDGSKGSNRNNVEQEQSSSNSSFEAISIGQSTNISTDNFGKHQVSLSSYQFSRPHRGESEKLIVRSYVNKLLPFSAFLVVVCVITGCILPSFSLELIGIVGVAVEYGRDFEEATLNHSVFSVIKLLLNQGGYLGTKIDYLGLAVLSALFLSTILFVPIIQSIILLRGWFSNSTALQKQKMAARVEILQAWQYLEVYLLALFISSWQLGPVSDFMINAYCKNLEATFAQMVYFGILKEKDAMCFGVTSRIGHNAFILVVGAILLAFLSSFVSKAVAQNFRDQEHEGLQMNRQNDAHNSFSSLTSQSNSDDGVSDSRMIANIRPVPVLFTDTFRWMLKASNVVDSSTRTLFVDHNNSHWSLPEATLVSSSNLPLNECMANDKNTSVLPTIGKTDIIASARSPVSATKGSSRKGSIDLEMSTSIALSEPYPRGNHDNVDLHKKNSNMLFAHQGKLKTVRGESISSLGQKSISSRIDSVESSFCMDQNFGPITRRAYIGSGFLTESPTPEVVSNTSSSGSSRKTPPPAAHCLSGKSRKKSPPHASVTFTGFIANKQAGLKKL